MPTHVLYIDDSGTKEYADDPKEYESRRGKSRYFVFGAALLSPDAVSRLSSRIIRLKLEYFEIDSVEIKSNWLRNPNEREKHYLQPFDVSEDELKEFVNRIYGAVVRADLILLGAVVDKKHMQEDYPNPWYAPAVAYDILLQRVQQQVGKDAEVSVIIDDMTGATPRGNQYKSNLSRQHQRLLQRGSALMKGMSFSCLHGSLKFVNSAHSQILQVADLISYNINRQFMDYGDEWETAGIGKLPTYPYFKRILVKFRQGQQGRIQGYGIAKFPLRRRIRWVVDE